MNIAESLIGQHLSFWAKRRISMRTMSSWEILRFAQNDIDNTQNNMDSGNFGLYIFQFEMTLIGDRVGTRHAVSLLLVSFPTEVGITLLIS